MSTRKVPFVSGEFYHLYNRGNSKQKIFHGREDYDQFIGLLYICNQEQQIRVRDIKQKDIFLSLRSSPLIAIGAYCIMPNHFHIIVSQTRDGGIAKFMQKVSTAYAMYYNQKYKRTGSLFEGKFKAEHVNTDRYLKYLFSYVHLNPVKLIEPAWRKLGIRNIKKSFEYINTYPYSSYTAVENPRNTILSLAPFPAYFKNRNDEASELLSWLSYKEPM